MELPSSLWLLTMAVSELVLVRVLVVLGQLYQALERVEVTSSLNIATALCRVASVVSMMILGITILSRGP